MLFGKYHIVIFKEGRSGSRNLRLRGWLGFAAAALALSLVAANVWLLRALSRATWPTTCRTLRAFWKANAARWSTWPGASRA